MPAPNFSVCQVPAHWQKDGDEIIDELVAKGYIEKVTTPSVTCTPSFFTSKKDIRNKPRMVCDLQALNKVLLRPGYPQMSSLACWKQVPKSARYFASFDCKSGYWQVRLDSETAHYTRFMTHKGQYEWKVLAMGLSPAGDEFNRIMDTIMEGAKGLRNFMRQVDDILLWGDSMEELVQQVDCFLLACKENFVSLSPKKTEFIVEEGETMDWGGKTLVQMGVPHQRTG